MIGGVLGVMDDDYYLGVLVGVGWAAVDKRKSNVRYENHSKMQNIVVSPPLRYRTLFGS